VNTPSNITSYFTGKKLIIPILIGILTAGYFFFQGFDIKAYNRIHWTALSSLWIACALFMVVTRLLGYSYRLIVLSNHQLSWKEAIQIIILWEFSSAISPGIVGGSAAAFILLAKEKQINAGKGTAMVLATSYLDVLFYVLAAPFLWLFVKTSEVIPTHINYVSGRQIQYLFLGAYALFLAWCILIFVGLFFKPQSIKRLALWIFKLPVLIRYENKVVIWGDNLVAAASNFRKEPAVYWLKAFGGTLVAWISRFLLVNFLILALGNGTSVATIFAKQLVMWGALMVPITPGAVGMAEWLFSGFMGEYFANAQLSNTTALLWRLLSYWPYLFAGIVVFPVWYNRVNKIIKSKSSI
jgi:glycosyltransferase 2 family protein